MKEGLLLPPQAIFLMLKHQMELLPAFAAPHSHNTLLRAAAKKEHGKTAPGEVDFLLDSPSSCVAVRTLN